MIHLNYRDGRPIYMQILDSVQNQIRSGVLQGGDQLPSVRELAAQLAINPNTIQRAYRELEAGGWIVTVPGKGCFVCEIGTAADSQQEELLQEFDKTVAALRQAGVSVQELVQRLQKGGINHA